MELTIQEIQEIETHILREVHDICERNNITYFLAYGSVLGAVRHNGPIPWDTDLDIIIPIDQFDYFTEVVTNELSDKFYLEYYKSNRYSTPLFGRIGLKGYSTRVLHIDVFKLIGLPDDLNLQKQTQKKLSLYQRLHYIKRIQKWDLINASIQSKISIYTRKLSLLFIPTKRIQLKHEYYCNLYPIGSHSYTTNASGGYGEREIIDKSLYGEGLLYKYNGIKVRIPDKYEEYLTHFYGDYMKLPPLEERKVKEKYKIIKLDI